MTRAGLLIALGLAAAAGVVFALWPALDLHAAALFYDQGRSGFVGDLAPWPTLRRAASWIVAMVAAPAVAALLLPLVGLRPRGLMPPRKAAFLIATLVLGPGLVVNAGLKDHWGRARPYELATFGGHDTYTPWWDPRGTCPRNCSFVAGEPSAAFWTLAPALLAPPPWRAAAVGGALAFGAAVGVLRMAAGGHFLSDVIFSGVAVFLVIWVTYAVLFRWRPRAPFRGRADSAAEGGRRA